MLKIIAPLFQHDIISKQLLKDNEVLLNTSLLPLNSYVNSLVHVIDNNYDEKLKQALLQLKPSLNILSSYVDNETFINSIKDFHISMYLFDISLNDLDTSNSKNQDLHTIYSTIKELVPNEIEVLNKLKKYLEVNRIKNTYITTFEVVSEYDKQLIKLLKANGLLDFENQKYATKNVEVYYANNIRAEIEASAQLIIDKQLTNAQVIYLNDQYANLIRQIYNRYGIKNSLDFNQKSTSFEKRFISIVALLHKKDAHSFINFLSSNPLNLKQVHLVSQINDVYNFDLQSFLEFVPTTIDLDNSKYYNDLIEKSKDNIISLQNTISSLLAESNDKIVENVFNYLVNNDYSNSLVTLSNKLLQNKDKIINSTDLVETLSNLLLNSQSSLINSDHVVVSSLKQHHYFNKEHVIILGSTIKNYPSLTLLSGVIDETYVSKLAYPKKTSRLSSQLDYLDLIKDGSNMYIFYPLSNYEGKGVEPSFSLLSFSNEYNAKPVRYPLLENDYYFKKEYKLDPEISKQLLLKDGKLNGSISSIELYNQSSYAYYLKYGLKLYPRSLPALSFNTIGTITHSIIEEIVTRKINGESSITEDEVISIINNGFKPYQILKDIKLDIIKMTLVKQFSHVLKHIEEIDNDTLFSPQLLEHKFNYKVNNNINIYGYIDRVDTFEDHVRVIDYKSSQKKLSETEFKRGLQLQLLTYLMAISSEMKLKPAGAYYMSLRFESVNTSPARVKRTKDYYIESTNDSYYADFISEHRINGWHFSEGEDFYKSAKHVISLSEKKDGSISTRNLFNFETVAYIVDEIYKDVYKRMSEGDISLEPVASPFAISDYKSIVLSPNMSNHREMLFKKQDLKKEIEENVDNWTTRSN